MAYSEQYDILTHQHTTDVAVPRINEESSVKTFLTSAERKSYNNVTPNFILVCL